MSHVGQLPPRVAKQTCSTVISNDLSKINEMAFGHFLGILLKNQWHDVSADINSG
jgi:hypothetical protein